MGIIILTGTPGTGKTTIARLLSKKINALLIEIKKIVEKNKTVFPKKGKEQIVDIKKLQKLVLDEIKNKPTSPVIIEGHLAAELKIPALLGIVLRCQPKILEKRLQKRNYSKQKIKENILAELLDYCTQVAHTNFKGKTRIVEIETGNKKASSVAREIIMIIKNKRRTKEISYKKELMEFLGLSHARSK